MNFSGKKVLVVGMAHSGMAAAKKLNDLGALVSIVDCARNTVLEQRALQLEERGISTRLGNHSFDDLNAKELVVVSPGVPDKIPFLAEARRRGILVWSEIELAYSLINLRELSVSIIGVTGTNGKTTTILLLEEIFKRANCPTIVAGNIGHPLVKCIEELEDGVTLIVELSSFQLKNIVHFKPHIGVLLNITQDHLDWHVDFKDYIQAKSRIFLNQGEGDSAVVNYDDPLVRGLLPAVKTTLMPFSKFRTFEKGVYIRGDKIVSNLKGNETEICEVEAVRIKGEHNLDNALAATAAALLSGISPEAINRALCDFSGVEHRLEYVLTIDGVDFYNDSKATNPGATIKALTAFNRPIVLLLGGRNKGNSFEDMAREVKERVKAVVLFGEATSEIKAALGNGSKVHCASSVPEAVFMAKELAESGDVVLFSPACASFDMFSNFEERGKVFKETVLSFRNPI
ncbi:MAG: UDP-N-acetylmuramoyl-L-alanine--D-glutamate ligase [Actinomycetota bacterium]